MWLFVGPSLLSGIGQVMNKYAQLMDCEYITFNRTPIRQYTHVFAFIIPHKETFELIMEKFNPDVIMTVCETFPVHEDYRLIFESGKKILVPSQFCKDVFQKQFNYSADIFPHWPGAVQIRDAGQGKSPGPYTFYTIGNVNDPRKNIKMLLDAFMQCNFGTRARLVIKATCKEQFNIKTPPGVLVLNGLMSDDHIDKIHTSCDCYVNCSKSEGVGMGAVEAAMRNKPVIITDFGGLKEYVKTPFVVGCDEECVGVYDFLYEPHMKWGKPSFDELVKHMKYCLDNDIRTWDHTHTREFTLGSMLRTKFSELCSFTLTRSSVDVSSSTYGDGCNRDDDSRTRGDWVLV